MKWPKDYRIGIITCSFDLIYHHVAILPVLFNHMSSLNRNQVPPQRLYVLPNLADSGFMRIGPVVMFIKPIFSGEPSSPVWAINSMQTIQISIHSKCYNCISRGNPC